MMLCSCAVVTGGLTEGCRALDRLLQGRSGWPLGARSDLLESDFLHIRI